MKTSLIRTFIENRRRPVSERIDASAEIRVLCREAPRFCVQALRDTRTHVSRKAELLAGLIRSPVERRQIVVSLQALSDAELLYVLDGLRVRRLNGRRARELGLASLVGHARFADLAANHRLRLVRIFRHLLGERTWSAVRRFLQVASPTGNRFLDRNVLRFATDAAAARETLCFLAGLGFDQPAATATRWPIVPWLKKPERRQFTFANRTLRQSAAARQDLAAGLGLPRATLSGLRGTYHRNVTRRELRELAALPAPRAHVDGSVTKAIKEAMVSSDVVSLDALVGQAARTGLPVVDRRAAVVLDLSGSTVSSGERLYHPAALGLALVGLLQRHVRDLTVFQVGGSVSLNGHGIPRPQGATDLATALLRAAGTKPQAILVITDGYENCRQGDFAQVISGLRQLGLATAVQQVTPVISAAENLGRRQLSETVPLVPVEHETGVGELAARLLLAGQPEELEPQVLPAVERLVFAV